MSVRSNIPMTRDEEGNWCVSSRQMRDGSTGSWTPRVPIQINYAPIYSGGTLIPQSGPSGDEGSSLPSMSTYINNKVNPKTAEAAKKPNSEEGLKKNLSAINATSQKASQSPAGSRTRTPLQEVKLDVDHEEKETRVNTGNSSQQGAGRHQGATSTINSPSERDRKGFAPAATSTPTREKSTCPKGADLTDDDDGLSDFKLLPILALPQEAAPKALNPLAEEWKPRNRQTDVPASPPSMDGPTTDGSESSWESDKEAEAAQEELQIDPGFRFENQMAEFNAFVQTGLMSESDKIAKWNSMVEERLLARRLNLS